MDQTTTLLLSAIGALAVTVAFLYFDNRSAARNAAKAHAKETADRDERFATVIKEATRLHQEQEDEIHKRHEKALAELVTDHKTEMSGMVDRAIEALRNDKA